MKIEALFGGVTRFSTIEALADAKQPVTAHQIAIAKGLDPAATYRCLTELSHFRIVEPVTGKRNQTLYKLSKGSGQAAAAFLQSLKQETPPAVDLEEWMSQEMQSRRIKKIVRLDKMDEPMLGNTGKKQKIELMSKRVPGELSALVASSKLAFGELFEQKNNRYILKA